MSHLVDDERGETLIELMLTILVMSIGMVTLVGAVGSSILASSTHRGLAIGDVVTRDYAEAIKQKAAENVDDTATPLSNEYFPCPGETQLDPGSAYAPPDGWDVDITGVEWWTSETITNGGWSSSNADCLVHYNACGETSEACDAGLQRVTFKVFTDVTTSGATSLTESIVVRRPNPETTT